MASKYLKNSEGIVRAVTSNNLKLEKPLLNENYDIEVHNRNMDKIDSAIQEVKGKVDGLELTAERVSIEDPTNKFEATNVEDALLENKTSILNNTNLANQALSKANEAFQRGDNVKSQLVDRLISEGLDVSTNNTFEELIGNIVLGKKWAKGTFDATQTSYTVRNLGFKPKLVFFSGFKASISYPYDITAFIKDTDFYSGTLGIEVYANSSTTKASVLKDLNSKVQIYDDGFYISPIYSIASDYYKFNWIAYE